METDLAKELADQFIVRIQKEQDLATGIAVLEVVASMLESAGYELALSHGPKVAALVIVQASQAQKTVAMLKKVGGE